MSVRLKRIEIEGFRGFSERQGIDLDADAILVRGDNGTGKTSLVDALLWLFSGKLDHLSDRVRGLRRTEDAVTNRFSTRLATVSLVVDAGGVDYTFTRTGNERKALLKVETADALPLREDAAEIQLAEVFGQQTPAAFRHAISTWGLLRQDAVRTALDASGSALHERLSGLIGLDKVTAFAAATSTASDTLVRERTTVRKAVDQAELRLREAEARRDEAQRAAGSPADVQNLIVEGVATAQEGLPASVTLTVRASGDAQAVATLGSALGKVTSAVKELRYARDELAEQPSDPAKLAEDAEAAVDAAADAAARSAEQAPQLVQLASAALGLLGDRCPVCEQPIDEATVRTHLDEILQSSRTVVGEAQEAQDELVRARAALATVRGQLTTHRAATDAADAAATRLANILSEVAYDVTLSEVAQHKPDDALVQAMEQSLAALRALYTSVNQASGAHVQRMADDADAQATELARASTELEGVEARCATAKALEHAAHDAAQSILESALDKLGPSFAEVFDRLSPNPAFTQLRASQDVMRNRNQIVPLVHDPERGIDANPLLVFSEGQLNVVALSYFLGMALNAREAALPFLVLDDPLQALDVIAILGFGDLCRQLRDRRQLLITTHDRRFADMLARKLAPRDDGHSLMIHDFQGWTREGPIVKTTRPERETVIRLIQQRAS